MSLSPHLSPQAIRPDLLLSSLEDEQVGFWRHKLPIHSPNNPLEIRCQPINCKASQLLCQKLIGTINIFEMSPKRFGRWGTFKVNLVNCWKLLYTFLWRQSLMYCQPVFFSLVVIIVCMSLLRFALYIILIGILLPLEWRGKIPNLFQLFNGDSNGFECTSRIHRNVLATSLVSLTRLASDKLLHTLLDMAISEIV